MRLLHIDSSITGAASASRAISADLVEGLRAATPSLDLVYRDLVAEPLPHLTLDALADPASNRDLQEFLTADVVVIGTGMYNFSVPSQLKAWLDRVLIAGHTFRYGPEGPVGLAGGKRVIVALARGGFYGADSPAAHVEHAERYLRAVLGFIGVTDLAFVIAEGVALGVEQRAAAMETALAKARDIGAQALAA